MLEGPQFWPNPLVFSEHISVVSGFGMLETCWRTWKRKGARVSTPVFRKKKGVVWREGGQLTGRES